MILQEGPPRKIDTKKPCRSFPLIYRCFDPWTLKSYSGVDGWWTNHSSVVVSKCLASKDSVESGKDVFNWFVMCLFVYVLFVCVVVDVVVVVVAVVVVVVVVGVGVVVVVVKTPIFSLFHICFIVFIYIYIVYIIRNVRRFQWFCLGRMPFFNEVMLFGGFVSVSFTWQFFLLYVGPWTLPIEGPVQLKSSNVIWFHTHICHIPGTCLSSIFSLDPSKTRPTFQSKQGAPFGFKVYISGICKCWHLLGWLGCFNNHSGKNWLLFGEHLSWSSMICDRVPTWDSWFFSKNGPGGPKTIQ